MRMSDIAAMWRFAARVTRKQSTGGRSLPSMVVRDEWWSKVGADQRAVSRVFHRVLFYSDVAVITGLAVDHGGQLCKGPRCEHCARAKQGRATTEP